MNSHKKEIKKGGFSSELHSRPATRDDVLDPKETRCGFPSCHPHWMRPCANIGCFTGFYSMAALVTSTLTVYVNSQITTLERQFGFNSTQTGLIMAANDIGFLICVLFVSFTASRVHIPRSLGIATLVFAVSGLFCSLPFFTFNKEIKGFTGGNMTSDSQARKAVFGDLCDVTNGSSEECGVNDAGGGSSRPSTVMPEYVAGASLIIIFIGMMLQGFGKAPRFSFTVTYIDDNTKKVNTGFFMGIIITCSIFGPALAFGVGGLFSRMYVTLEETDLTPTHPRWIGAWWLGYVVFGAMALVIALPLFSFPRRLPSRSEEEKGEVGKEKSKGTVNGHAVVSEKTSGDVDPSPNEKEAFLKTEETSKETKEVLASEGIKHNKNKQTLTGITWGNLKFKDVLNVAKSFVMTLVRLWTNPIYMCMVASMVFVIFTVSGTSAYSPKYLERIFQLPAYKANYILGAKTLTSACLGTFIGGYLSKRMKMTAMLALKFSMAVTVFSTLALGMNFFFYCDAPTIHNFPDSTEAEHCNGNCGCDTDSYFPICGADQKTYYSPCHAGCQEIVNSVYTNCTCIEGGTAYSGICDYSCNQLIPFVIFMALRSLFSTVAIVPKIIVCIRCVEPRDKPLAVGFSSFMTSLLGWMVGPIAFGNIIDGICVVWDVTCGVVGRCLMYDNNLFRLKFHGYCVVSLGLSVISLLIAYVYARCTGVLDHDETEAEAEGEGELQNGEAHKEYGHDRVEDMELIINADDNEKEDHQETETENNRKEISGEMSNMC